MREEVMSLKTKIRRQRPLSQSEEQLLLLRQSAGDTPVSVGADGLIVLGTPDGKVPNGCIKKKTIEISLLCELCIKYGSQDDCIDCHGHGTFFAKSWSPDWSDPKTKRLLHGKHS
jgi:hypothetical protein